VPENTGYMVAAYIVTAAILLTYAVHLYLRIRNVPPLPKGEGDRG
jgi:hypothetical protein